MIKKLDYLFSNGKYIHVFSFCLPIIFGTFLGIARLLDVLTFNNKPQWPLFLILSLIISGMVTGLDYILRSLNSFYRAADEIEKLAREATTKRQLADIWNEKLIPLWKHAGFRKQGDRLREITRYMEGRMNKPIERTE